MASHSVLASLGHPLRWRIVEQLLRTPGITQEQLRDVLGQKKGTMSKALAPLLTEGVVKRDTPRGPLYLPFELQTRATLEATAQLAEAITEARAAETREDVGRLRASRLKVVRDATHGDTTGTRS